MVTSAMPVTSSSAEVASPQPRHRTCLWSVAVPAMARTIKAHQAGISQLILALVRKLEATNTSKGTSALRSSRSSCGSMFRLSQARSVRHKAASERTNR